MSEARPRNITLIGMPGSGKTTVGQRLAHDLGWPFLDLDQLIEQRRGQKLWQINEAGGHALLQQLEDDTARSLDVTSTVISPGGSIVYLPAAMRHLQTLGPVVYLDVPLGILNVRCGDMTLRGVVVRPGMTLGDLLEERRPLLEQWATAVIACKMRGPKDIATEIVARLCAPANPEAAT